MITERECETFHGRDLFGPVAAHLSRGVLPSHFGKMVGNPVELTISRGKVWEEGAQGRVLFVDSFGNVVTDIENSVYSKFLGRVRCIEVNGVPGEFTKFYGALEKGRLGVIPGSFGRIELSIRGGNASHVLSLQRGGEVRLERR